jgi:hypothetical protein
VTHQWPALKKKRERETVKNIFKKNEMEDIKKSTHFQEEDCSVKMSSK